MPARVAHNEWTSETTTLGAVRLPSLGDERLARLAARGRARAFAAVYERYHQPLYRYCRSIVRDDADAQDALQSTFTRALSALKRDQRSAPLRPWLFRIAHNESISVLRRRRAGSGPAPLDAGSIPLAPSAEDQAGERARLGVLMGDLAALPDRARNALVMRELSGLSHQDIAIALEISEGAAKQAIFEARRGLQECAEGRTMPCAEVCRAISDADRRVLRGRRVRAHLRDCASCATFASAIKTRRSELSALVPVLPAASSVAVLSRVMESGVGHAAAAGGGVVGGGVAGSGAAVAGTAGKTLGIAMGSKGFAAASLLATAAVSVGGVAAVVRLAHDGRPALSAGGRHAVVARPAAHTIARARSGSGSMTGHARGLPSIATRGRRVTAPAKSPARITPAQGHGRAASWHGRPASSHGQSGSLSHGQSATSSDGKSASSHGKGHANGASHGHGVGKQTAPGLAERSVTSGVAEEDATVHAHPSRGDGAGKKVGTDVAGSQALTGRKGHK